MIESSHAENNRDNLKRVELKYELTWGRFDLLIYSKDSDSFLSRPKVRVFFVELFEQFQAIEPTLQQALYGDQTSATSFYREVSKLY